MSSKKMTTSNSGNTKPSLAARHFQFTINDVETWEEVRDYIIKSKMFNYGIACKEIAPTTGHEHIHFYAQFTAPKRISLKKICGAHVEICRGTPQANVDYIKKDGNIIFEEGILRKTGARSIKDVKDMNREERDDLDIRYYNIVKQINFEEDKEIDIDDWHKDVKVIYITGPSGAGKTQMAKKLVKSHTNEKINVVKHVNSFWEGVGKAKVCIYDEFRDSQMRASEFINFIDYNKHLMNVKGGEMRNNYETIIITSTQKPEEIYNNWEDEEKKQWLRRIKVISLYDKEIDDSF